jgi:very-short-patch-repair endonuclease
MRSLWEVLTAEYLDNLKVDWEYEPEVIKLSTGGYLPDFVLKNGKVIIEVKGYFSEKDQERVSELKQLGYKIVIYNQKKLKTLNILTSSTLKFSKELKKSGTFRPRQKTSTQKVR